MKRLSLGSTLLLAVAFVVCQQAVRAQGMWGQSSYTVVDVEYSYETGSNSAYTYSGDSNKGILTASSSGTTSGSADIWVLYQVTFTWSGGSPVGFLAATPYADINGDSTAGPGSSASAYSMASTTAFGGLSNSTSSPPNYPPPGPFSGSITTVTPTPSGPVTFQIAGAAYANYSGTGSATADTAVFFN